MIFKLMILPKPKTCNYIQMYTTQNITEVTALTIVTCIYDSGSKGPHCVSLRICSLNALRLKFLSSAANASHRPLYQSGVGVGAYF